MEDGDAAAPIICFRDNVIRVILFSEEVALGLERLQTHVQRYPQRRIIVYPLLVLLIIVLGIIIASSLINFSTTVKFSYD